jgi:hypothetical protein
MPPLRGSASIDCGFLVSGQHPRPVAALAVRPWHFAHVPFQSSSPSGESRRPLRAALYQESNSAAGITSTEASIFAW